MAAAPNVVVFALLRTLMAIAIGGGQVGIVTHGEPESQQYPFSSTRTYTLDISFKGIEFHISGSWSPLEIYIKHSRDYGACSLKYRSTVRSDGVCEPEEESCCGIL